MERNGFKAKCHVWGNSPHTKDGKRAGSEEEESQVVQAEKGRQVLRGGAEHWVRQISGNGEDIRERSDESRGLGANSCLEEVIIVKYSRVVGLTSRKPPTIK